MSHGLVLPRWCKALVLGLLAASPALGQGPPKPPGPPDGSRRGFGRGLSALQSTQDLNYGGTSTATLDYDARGNLRTWSVVWDWDENGIADYRDSTSYAYDRSGNPVSILFLQDWDGDGVNETISVTDQAFDRSGNLVQDLVTDLDVNGVPTRLRGADYTNDSRGLPLQVDGWQDLDADGTPDEWSLELFTYDRAGRLRTRDWTWTRDLSSTSEVFTYDPSGRLVNTWSERVLPMMAFEQISTLSYDEGGRLLQEVSESFGEGLFTPAIVWEDYQYSGNGRLLRWDVRGDDWKDGTIDWVTTTAWQYDRKGNLQQEDYLQTKWGKVLNQYVVYFTY